MKNKKIVVTPLLEIKQRRLQEVPLWFFESNNREEDSLKSLEGKVKEICGDPWDNSGIKFSNVFGHLFSISIGVNTSHEKWYIHVWDDSGGLTIGNFTQSLVNKEFDLMSNDTYNAIAKRTEDFNRGKINCCNCDTQCDYQEVKRHRYFAGIYCKECWENKYKAIEARETYN